MNENAKQPEINEADKEVVIIADAIRQAGQMMAMATLARGVAELIGPPPPGTQAVDIETVLMDTTQRIACKLGILP